MYRAHRQYIGLGSASIDYWPIMGYGKDSFLGQPYKPLGKTSSQKRAKSAELLEQ
jgi:hypothetical protein